MDKEIYDDLEWEIEGIPVGSSTPDELFELSYRATAECPNCGEKISGIAQMWSRYEDMFQPWLERVDYTPCEYCTEDEDLEDDE